MQKFGIFAVVALLGFLWAVSAAAQDLQLGVTYTCSGERVYLENCNIRDLSDTSTCMVAHPDRPAHNGLMAYTTETRGALRKLLPTCKQPSADEVARAKAHYKKQNDLQTANEKKANDEADAIEARAQAVVTGKKPQTAEEKAINRCLTAGRLPASCTGNALLGAFGQMISGVLPAANKEPPAGPAIAGVFLGAGNWRLDFIDGGVLVNCSFLSPDEHHYAIDFKNNRAVINIETTPKPLVLTLKPDLTMAAPGPVVLDGVVATQASGGGYLNRSGTPISDAEAASSREPVYDSSGQRVSGPISSSHTVFVHKTATCPALNLSSKANAVGIQTMQTDLLKTMFGGDKGPPTPPGIRMRGIFAASTGFSAQFFPESVILGCGPDIARAYPYTVVADGTKSFIKIDAPDHPLTVAFRPDGSLDAGAGPYEVHGRTITGQNDDGDFTFAPLNATCNLGLLTAGNIPATAPIPASPFVTGNAVLSISSGFPMQPGVANPLAGHSYVLLRDDFATALNKGGFAVPTGITAFKAIGNACANRTLDCQKVMPAVKADTASAARADTNGKATLPGVPAGTYYLMISSKYNNQNLFWGFKVELQNGANSVTLEQRNAVPLN